MKVLLVNGSAKSKGCVYTALTEVVKGLNEQGVMGEIFHIQQEAVSGCQDCGVCFKTGKCAINDVVNELAQKAQNFDGFIFGSPVYYASLNGSFSAVLDRLFFSASRFLAYKPAAGIVCARRAGTTSALDELNKYFTINCMPVVSSRYWNMVFGRQPDDVKQDLEGLQVMRVLGKNMAWLLKCIDAGKKAGIDIPKMTEERQYTNFIR